MTSDERAYGLDTPDESGVDIAERDAVVAAMSDVSAIDCLCRIAAALERIASAQELPRSTSRDDWLRLTLTRIARAIEAGSGGLQP